MFNLPEVHMKKTLLLVLAVMLCVSLSNAQYTNDASFPSDTLLKAVQTHGVTVDPAGKVWVIPFSLIKGDSVLSNGVNRAVAAIRVYNANGTKASFSPLSILAGSGISDTLFSATNQRGINIDKDGNVLFTYSGTLYRINYKTGAAMGKVAIVPTGAGVQVAPDTIGNVFTAFVSQNIGPIQMFDASFTKQGNITDTSRFFCRAIAASKAGDKVYYAGYTAHAVIRYTGDPLFGYTADTVLKGFDCESINRHGKTDWLWAAAGSGNDMPNRYPGVVTSYSAHTWYLWNPADDKIKDSIKWAGSFLLNAADSAAVRPRGVATTTNGDTVYVAMFGSKTGMYSVQRFVKGPTSVRREDGIVAGDYSLSQNYPNPFNPSTKLKFTLKSASTVSLTVYDVLGKEVSTLATGDYAAGSYDVDFNASSLSAGVYFYTLKTSNGFSLTKKMLLVK